MEVPSLVVRMPIAMTPAWIWTSRTRPFAVSRLSRNFVEGIPHRVPFHQPKRGAAGVIEVRSCGVTIKTGGRRPLRRCANRTRQVAAPRLKGIPHVFNGSPGFRRPINFSLAVCPLSVGWSIILAQDASARVVTDVRRHRNYLNGLSRRQPSSVA